MPATEAADLRDVFAGSVAWGRIRPGGPWHAFRPAWWDEDLWVPQCRHGDAYSDLQLVSLDAEPGGPGICANAGCLHAYHACRLPRRARIGEVSDG